LILNSCRSADLIFKLAAKSVETLRAIWYKSPTKEKPLILYGFCFETFSFGGDFLKEFKTLTLKDAYTTLKDFAGIPFKELFPDKLTQIKEQKGCLGQQIELLIGKSLDNRHLDFLDGELKTFPLKRSGKQYKGFSSMAICAISSNVDSYIHGISFEESVIGKKIANMILQPVCKSGEVGDWYLPPAVHIGRDDDKYANLYEKIKTDYESICREIKRIAESGENLKTLNGSNGLLQIRTKDSKNKSGRYHPIFLKHYNRFVSNKNYAFYFTSDFCKEIVALNFEELSDPSSC